MLAMRAVVLTVCTVMLAMCTVVLAMTLVVRGMSISRALLGGIKGSDPGEQDMLHRAAHVVTHLARKEMVAHRFSRLMGVGLGVLHMVALRVHGRASRGTLTNCHPEAPCRSGMITKQVVRRSACRGHRPSAKAWCRGQRESH